MNMRSLIVAPIASVLVLSLAGCANSPQNRSLESVHQPVVSRSNYAIDLNVAPGGSLSLPEQRKLSEWFDAMGLGYGDRVAIDDPHNSPTAQAMIEAIVSRKGLLLANTAPLTTGEIWPGSLRVVVTRSTAQVPGCPDWKTTSDNNFNNGLSSNYGCSTNSNLAAMVANPEDLLHGQPGSGQTTASTSGKAIKSYRDAVPTGTGGLKAPSTQSGGDE